MSYGTLIAMQIDPIEKKPFNHFMPGTRSFGVGTSSCNFGCLYCLNHNISKEREITGTEVKPEEAVEMALENGAESIAYTYNEPAIFIEYVVDTARLAHRKGLANVMVTNGYMTKEAVASLKGLVDAAVVNFKGNGDEKFANKYEAIPSADPIKESLLEMKKAGMHLEITDLVVPRVGDSTEACDRLTRWIHDNLGADTPTHFLTFYPNYKMLDYPPTSYETLKKHYDIARKNGLNYVYIGNAPGNPYEDTYCPGCGSVVVKRSGLSIARWNLTDDMKCKKCGHQIFMNLGKPNKLTRKEEAGS
jgi:pyruvate formate lyase activating enzyme